MLCVMTSSLSSFGVNLPSHGFSRISVPGITQNEEIMLHCPVVLPNLNIEQGADLMVCMHNLQRNCLNGRVGSTPLVFTQRSTCSITLPCHKYWKFLWVQWVLSCLCCSARSPGSSFAMKCMPGDLDWGWMIVVHFLDCLVAGWCASGMNDVCMGSSVIPGWDAIARLLWSTVSLLFVC